MKLVSSHTRNTLLKKLTGIPSVIWARELSRYSDWLRAGRSGDRILVGARFSAPVQTSPGAHLASCTMGTTVAHRPPNHNNQCTQATKPQQPVHTGHQTTTSAHRPPNYNQCTQATKPQQPVHTGHQTTTTSAHRPPTFTVHDKQHKHFCLQVTHKVIRSSLKMADGCRNMSEPAYQIKKG
jgi:cell division septation protein DedD